MKVTSIMTRNVVTVEMDDPLETVRVFLKNIAFHSIPVVEDQRLVGVISDSDLFAEEWRDTNALNKKAYEIMDKVPVTVDKETSIEKADKLLLNNNVSCLPVLSSEGIIEGIVTRRNIINFYSKNKNGCKTAIKDIRRGYRRRVRATNNRILR